MFRITSKYRNLKFDKVLEFFKLIPIDKMSMFAEEKLFDINESADKKSWSAIRLRVTTAPLVTDREQVSIVNVRYLDDGKVFFCARSIDDDRFPLTKNRIRCASNELYEMSETEENGEKIVTMNGCSTFDLKGYIPPSLLNMATANNIFKINQTMVKVLKE